MSFLEQAKPIEATNNGLHIIMGEAGSGKTTFAGSYPTPILHISLGNDGGYKVLQGKKDTFMLPALTTDSTVYKTGKGMRMYDKLNALLLEIFQTKDHGYKTIIIDPVTEVQEDLVYFLKKKKGKNLSFDEWAIVSDLMADLFKKCEYLAQSLNLVLICHTKTVESEDTKSGTKITKIIPNFTESTAKRITKNADMVAWIGSKRILLEDEEIERMQRYMVVGVDPILPTKIRLPEGKSLDGEYITDLTYDGLQEIIKNL